MYFTAYLLEHFKQWNVSNLPSVVFKYHIGYRVGRECKQWDVHLK